MEITEVFYPTSRTALRAWLETNHLEKTEVWIQIFPKSSEKYSLPYDVLVEECLCFGWIDGIKKKYDSESTAQRITPRRKKSFLSELNRQRIWKLQQLGLMNESGIAPIAAQIGDPNDALVIPNWILEKLQANEQIWIQFQAFSHFYKRLKISWITEAGQLRQEEMDKRLNYLLKMTAQGKMYGTQPFK